MSVILERDSGSFQAKIRKKGLPKLSKTFPTREAAEAWAVGQEDRLTPGNATVDDLAGKTSFGDALRWYKTNVTAHKRSKRTEESKISVLLGTKLEPRPMNTIKPEDIEEMVAEMVKAGRVSSTARNYVALVSHLFNVHIKRRRMRSLANPTLAIEWPKPAEPRKRRFKSKAEEEALYRELDKRCNPMVRPLAEFLAESAMRIRTEALRMQWPDVDLKSGVVQLYKTKNGEDRVVALTPRAIEILEALPRDEKDDRVFRISYFRMCEHWKAACKAAGIKDLIRHDMRREATAKFFEVHGLEQLEVASITGHKTLSMLRDYARLKATRTAQKLKKA